MSEYSIAIEKKKQRTCFCQSKQNKVLSLPDFVDAGRGSRTISVDECIADVVGELLKNGIQTRGCCCGHNKKPPSIIISEDCSQEDIRRTRLILRHDDNHRRKWQILKWQLVDLNKKRMPL